MYVPGVLCKNHGPFAWGKNAAQAVYNAVVMEEVAKMNMMTGLLSPDTDCHTPQCMLDKHFMRKHGPNAYYGQGK